MRPDGAAVSWEGCVAAPGNDARREKERRVVRQLFLFVVALVMGAAASVTLAEPGQAHVITRASAGRHAAAAEAQILRSYRVRSTGYRQIRLVDATGSDTDGIVSRELSEQPVHPFLFRVVLPGGNTIHLDPQDDYLRQGPFRIGQDHHLLKAQRLYRALHPQPAHVVRSSRIPADVDPADARPGLIIFHPATLPPPNGRAMPMVPSNPLDMPLPRKHPQMAQR